MQNISEVMMQRELEKGVELCRNGAFGEAIDIFNQVLEKAPHNSIALYNRARAYSRLGQIKHCLADFKKLVTIESQNATFIGDYAVALHLNGEDQMAAQEFERALALEPTNPYRYSSRAFFRDRTGDFEGAIADYEKAIELDPEDAIALNNKGLVEEKLGYKDKAKQSFSKSNKLVDYDPEKKTSSTSAASKAAANDPEETPTTRWQAIKHIFTNEGFKDFRRFSVDLFNPKKKIKN